MVIQRMNEAVRIYQNEVDETAGIVYQVAEEAVERDQPVEFVIEHMEPDHVNLGRGLELHPEIDADLQYRRPGGGGYVPHRDTYCFGIAVPKNNPKVGLEYARNALGRRVQEALDDCFRQNVRYVPEDGDIYVGVMGSQVAGIGTADIDENFGNATAVRACIYPERPDTELQPDGEIKKDILPVRNLEKVRQLLEPEEMEGKDSSEFVSDQNSERAKRLQKEEGWRECERCFSRQAELKK